MKDEKDLIRRGDALVQMCFGLTHEGAFRNVSEMKAAVGAAEYEALRSEVERLTRERDEAEGANILNRAALKNALARVAELEAIQRIAHVQVDGDGDLWLHLDGGKNYKASVNVSAKFATHRGVVHGGVRQAAEALRDLLATDAPSAAERDAGRCPRCGWHYASTAEKGCVPGNCSYRPPEDAPDYARVKAWDEAHAMTQPSAKPEPTCATCGGDGWRKVEIGRGPGRRHLEGSPCPDCPKGETARRWISEVNARSGTAETAPRYRLVPGCATCGDSGYLWHPVSDTRTPCPDCDEPSEKDPRVSDETGGAK